MSFVVDEVNVIWPIGNSFIDATGGIHLNAWSAEMIISPATLTAVYCAAGQEREETEEDLKAAMEVYKTLTFNGKSIAFTEAAHKHAEGDQYCELLEGNERFDPSIEVVKYVTAFRAPSPLEPLPEEVDPQDTPADQRRQLLNELVWWNNTYEGVYDMTTDGNGNLFLGMHDGVRIIRCNNEAVATVDEPVIIGEPYPNPANTSVVLPLPENTTGMLTVQVLDLAGNIRYNSTQQAAGAVTLNVSPLPPGTYVAIVKTEGGSGVRRFMVQR
jgi:hypothetical protein